MPLTDANSSKALTADLVNTLYNLRGTGLKIGIISDSYNVKGGAANDVASGDLPNNVVLVREGTDPTGDDDEGRAMMELAYRIAPGATYYFASGDGGIAAMASAVTSLQNQGCNIIIDDLGYGIAEGFYQVGTVLDNAISAAVASGINYFSAAGNDSKVYYEHGFTPMTTIIAGIEGGASVTVNDFGGGNPYLSITIGTDASLSGTFEWAQPFASIGTSGKSAANSLALYLLNSAGAVVASATTDRVGGDPGQTLSFENMTADTSFRLVIVQNGGTVPTGQLFKLLSSNGGITINDPNANKGSGNIFGHELLGNQNSLGAVNYLKTPAFGTSPAVPTDFTSVGPGTILFDAQGNLLATPINAKEPNFSAAQGSNTAVVPKFAPFDGTSAAAPNAGAVAALALEANRALTTAQVTALMAQSAIPITSSLPDTGAGLIQARAMAELAAASAGSRWTAGGGGNWTDAGSWSTGAAPTAARSALIGDDLGGFTGSYTLTANTTGLVSGSLAVGAGAGSSATLAITAGGGLAVGGSSAANPTAGDLLVSNNGRLAMSGGTLSVSRSLNTNNGAVSVTGGSVSAGDYWQNAGSFVVGGGGTSAAVTLTGDGMTQMGGSLTLSAQGTLQATKASVSASSFTVGAGGTFISAAALAFDSAIAAILAGGTASAALISLATTSAASVLTIAGMLSDGGALSGSGANSRIEVQGGGVLTVGGATSQAGISLTGAARLVLSSTDANVRISGYNATISGLISGLSQVDFTGLAYSATDTTSYSASNGQLDILDSGGARRAALLLNTADNYTAFTLAPDASNTVVLRAVACFGRGTLIEAEGGEVPVEALVIGQLVRTASGALRPIRWIGRRAYAGAFAAGNRKVLPVTIRAGAIGDGLPRRDLVVSPLHAMLVDGVLVPAVALLNGRSIVQAEAVEQVEYVHVELESHDVLLAEGAPSESFVDDNSRGMFQNVAEFHALYPDPPALPALYCAPRLEDGPAVEAIRARLDALARPALEGRLDVVTHDLLAGWALDPAAPDAAVRLVVRDRGVVIARVVADAARPDVAAAGFGTGFQGVLVAFDPPLVPWQAHEITVEREGDGARLGSPMVLAAMAPPALGVPAAERVIRGRLDGATHGRVHGWAYDEAHPAAPVRLAVFVNGAVLGRVVANRHREDLAAAGIGAGRHAFEVLVPGGLSPLVDQVIEVRREDDGAVLPGSPLLIPAAAGFDTALQDAVSRAVGAAATLPGGEDAAAFLRTQADRLDRGQAEHEVGRSGAKRALMIDARIPAAGRDAGSCALLSHMAALQGLGYAVSFAAASGAPVAGDALARMGARWCGLPQYGSIEEVLRRQAGCFDVIYLHGEGVATRYAGLARAYCGNARLIYSVADLHHLRLERQAAVEACPQLLAESRGMAVREFMAAWAVDAVVTHSGVEAAILRRAVPQASVHVVPWAVPARARAPGLRGRADVGFIGHFGHAPNRDAARVLVETVMPLVWAVDSTIGCVIAGSDMPAGLLAGGDQRVTLLGSIGDLDALFGRVRVMAAPLRFGAGIKGKVLDSLAAGLPCVMSPVAAEGLDLPGDLAGLVGAEPAEIAAAILRLHGDDAAWRSASRAGLTFIRAGYGVAAVEAGLKRAIGREAGLVAAAA